jgi:hypothetical protein
MHFAMNSEAALVGEAHQLLMGKTHPALLKHTPISFLTGQ